MSKVARNIIGALVALGVSTILLIWLDEGVDRVLDPWAYAKPPLTGDWEGEAVAGNTRLRLVLFLSRDRGKFAWLSDDHSGFSNRGDLSGRAVVCDSTGRVQSYPVYGNVVDRQARKTALLSSWPPDESPGLRPEKFDLSWDGGTVLRSDTHLVHAWGSPAVVGSRWSSSDPVIGHPIPFLLHPVSASAQTCTVPPAVLPLPHPARQVSH